MPPSHARPTSGFLYFTSYRDPDTGYLVVCAHYMDGTVDCTEHPTSIAVLPYSS